MFVVHVPKGALFQHPEDIGDLGEHRGIWSCPCRLREQPEKLLDVGHVLEDMASHDQIRREVGVVGVVPLLHELESARVGIRPVGQVSRIDADARRPRAFVTS